MTDGSPRVESLRESPSDVGVCSLVGVAGLELVKLSTYDPAATSGELVEYAVVE